MASSCSKLREKVTLQIYDLIDRSKYQIDEKSTYKILDNAIKRYNENKTVKEKLRLQDLGVYVYNTLARLLDNKVHKPEKAIDLLTTEVWARFSQKGNGDKPIMVKLKTDLAEYLGVKTEKQKQEEKERELLEKTLQNLNKLTNISNLEEYNIIIQNLNRIKQNKTTISETNSGKDKEELLMDILSNIHKLVTISKTAKANYFNLEYLFRRNGLYLSGVKYPIKNDFTKVNEKFTLYSFLQGKDFVTVENVLNRMQQLNISQKKKLKNLLEKYDGLALSAEHIIRFLAGNE